MIETGYGTLATAYCGRPADISVLSSQPRWYLFYVYNTSITSCERSRPTWLMSCFLCRCLCLLNINLQALYAPFNTFVQQCKFHFSSRHKISERNPTLATITFVDISLMTFSIQRRRKLITEWKNNWKRRRNVRL